MHQDTLIFHAGEWTQSLTPASRQALCQIGTYLALFGFSFSLFIYYYCICVCTWCLGVDTCAMAYIWSTLWTYSFLPPLPRFWELNSGLRACAASTFIHRVILRVISWFSFSPRTLYFLYKLPVLLFPVQKALNCAVKIHSIFNQGYFQVTYKIVMFLFFTYLILWEFVSKLYLKKKQTMN